MSDKECKKLLISNLYWFCWIANPSFTCNLRNFGKFYFWSFRKAIWNIEARIRKNFLYSGKSEQFLEKVSVYRTTLLLKSDAEVKGIENLQLENECSKCVFSPIYNVFKIFRELENSTRKCNNIIIAGYICRKDERIDNTSFYLEKYGTFLKTIDWEELKVTGDMICQRKDTSFKERKIPALSNLLKRIRKCHALCQVVKECC